jgi:hypothetical protein
MTADSKESGCQAESADDIFVEYLNMQSLKTRRELR